MARSREETEEEVDDRADDGEAGALRLEAHDENSSATPPDVRMNWIAFMVSRLYPDFFKMSIIF